MPRPLVHVCTGSSCRDEKKSLGKLLDALEDEARVQTVRCQKICDGPVVGTAVDGTLEWFEEIDSGRLRAALLKLLATGKMSRSLKKRRVKKRRGKLRR